MILDGLSKAKTGEMSRMMRFENFSVGAVT
jgi:hypothetical protein